MGKKYYKDTSPLAMGRQQKGSIAQKAEQRRTKKKQQQKGTEAQTQSSSNVSKPSAQTGYYNSSRRRARNNSPQKSQPQQRTSTYRSVNRNRNNTAQTAEQMRQQRQTGVQKAIDNRRDPLGINQQKQTARTNRYNRNNPQTAEETRKLKEQEKQKQSKVMDTKSAPSYYGASMKQGKAGKLGQDLAGTVEHTLKQTAAAESRMFWETAKGKHKADPFIQNLTTEKERQEAEAKADRNIQKYADRIEKESLELENLKEGHSWLGQRTLEATSSGVGMLTDIAWGPASLGHMWMRSTGTARGQVTKRAEALRSNLEQTGLYSDEELDEMFKNVDTMDMLNAGINGGIEVLSEKLFTGIGVAKKVGGVGMADKIASKLFNKVGGRFLNGTLGRIAKGTVEEITEEEVGGPLQVLAGNLIYGNKFQNINEDATKRMLKQESDSLIGQIESPEQAQIISTRLSSDEFLEDAVESYKEAGFTDEESKELAEQTREYLTASLTGDTDRMEELRDEMAITMTAGDRSMKEHWGLQDAIDVAVSTAIMTSVSGVPNSVNTTKMGNAYKNSAGMDGVKNLAEITANWDADASDSAQAIVDRINEGEDITGTQVAELIGQASEAATQAMRDEDSKWQVAQRQMKEHDLRVTPATRTEDGTLVLSENTQQRYDQIVKETVDRYAGLEKIGESEGISKEDVELGADLSAAMQTGVISAEQINELVRPENEGVRRVFEDVTGIDLSQFDKNDRHGKLIAESNIAMRKGLMALAANNLVNSARLEQVAWNDEARGELGQIMSAKMEGKGGEALIDALSKVDPRDRDIFVLTGEAARDVYSYGRYGLDDWANLRRYFEEKYKGVDIGSLKSVFEAARFDKEKGENPYYGKAVEAQEQMNRNSLAEGEPAYVPGMFTNKSERALKGEEIKFLSGVSNEIGINTIMADPGSTFEFDGKEIVLQESDNGIYIPSARTIILNSQNTMGENIKQIFSHEVTHHLAVYAPDEYLKLSRFVMDRWFKQNPEEFTQRIERIQNLYKEKRNQSLTPEQALEEMIADGTIDFWQDERFMRDIAEAEPTLAQKIINSIKDLLRKLRNILATGNIKDEETRRGLFELIDGYETAYNMWINAYNSARRGQTQETIDAWQEKANEGFTISDISITRDEIIDNFMEVASTEEPVSLMTGKEFAKGEISLNDQVEEFFKSLGYKVHSEVFGDVELSDKTFDDDLGHGMGRNKAISFTAIPDVIQKGKIIDAQHNWKNKGWDSFVVAAPVRIAKDDYFMAVVVRRDKNINLQRHYVHEVFLQKITDPFKPVATQSSRTHSGSAYIFTILGNLVRVKNGMLSRNDIASILTTQEGKFSLSDSDMIVRGKTARWTDDRIDTLIREYGASNPDYSQAYAVLMDPRDFLKLTLRDQFLKRWNETVNDPNYDEVYPLDKEKLRENKQTPYLAFHSKNGIEVTGHEGRHRMRALMEAGVKSVPVVIQDMDTKYSKQNMDSLELSSQDATNLIELGYEPINNDAHITINDLVPIKSSNRDELIQKFGGEADVRFSISETESDVASQATNPSSGDTIMSAEEISSTLKENFDDYKADEENLRIATEAIESLQNTRWSINADNGRRMGRPQIRTIAKGITSDLVREGYIEFRGRKVNGPEDLAKLCQVLRDPRFETFRIVLTKGNKIVSFTSVSSRLPHASLAWIPTESNTKQESAKIIKDRMARLGADGYYLIHNHPSGDVTESWNDLSVTRDYLALLGRNSFKGHIILDHDKFGLIEDIPQTINGWTVPTQREVPITGQQTIDLIHEPEIDHPLLGETISGNAAKAKSDIAKIGRFVNASDDISVLVYASVKGTVRGLQEVSNKTILNNKELKGYIKNQSVEFGSARVFLYTTDADVYRNANDMVKSGHLQDAIYSYDNSSKPFGAVADDGVRKDANIDTMGMTEDDERKKTRVFESAAGVEEYGQRFSLDAPVEQTRDLIAIHNLTPDKLRGDFRLGGFPMPSIAVTNQEHVHFGEISLLFGSDTIDPQKDRANRVYSADAWTPTVPQTEYESDMKVVDRAYKRVRDAVGDFLYLKKGLSSDFHYENIERNLLRHNGFDGFIADVMNKPALKYAYLKDKGIDIEIPYKEGTFQGHGAEVWKKLDAALPDMTRSEAFNMGYEESMKYDPIIREVLLKDLEEKMGEEAGRKLRAAKLYAEPFAWGKVTRYLSDLVTFREGGGIIKVVDDAALEQSMDERIDMEDYRSWTKDLFDGLIKNEGVRNNKDPFTPAGERRSFKSLHYPVTLDGIIHAMKEQGGKNVSWHTSTKTLRADTAKSFRSLDEIRKDKGKLKNLDEDAVNATYEELDKIFYEILNSIGERKTGEYDIYAADSIADIMSECAQLGYTEPAQVIKKYKSYGWTVTESEAKDILQLFDGIRNMPVNMFEAKPRRAVGFNEVKAAILPSDIAQDIRDELELMDIPVYEYEAQNEEDRQRAVNEAADAQDVRFSIAEGMTPEERFEELKDEDIDIITANKSDLQLTPEEFKKLRDELISKAKPEAIRLARSLGVIGSYNNDDIEFEFEFTGKGLKESAQKQFEIKSNERYVNFVNLMSRLDDVIHYARLIRVYDEAEYQRDNPGHKINENLKDTYVLVSAFIDGETIIPVKLTVMEYKDSRLPKLHVAMTASEIEKSRIITTRQTESNEVATSTSNVKLALLLGEVKDESLAKHIPQQFRDDSERFDPNNDDIRYSMATTDSTGKVLTDGQMEYFKNSQARDEQGRLVPVYHGTQNGGFTIFDSRYGISSRYFFFVDNMSAAKGYSGSEKTFSESVAGEEDMRLNYKVYLDMVNPLIVDAQGNSWVNIPYEDDFVTTNWLAEYAESEGYDGVIVKNVIDRGSADTEYAPQTDYIVFSSNQVKDVNNENPTENPDIRYSVTSEDDALDWLASQYELDDVPLDDAEAEEGRVRMAKSKEEFIRRKNVLWNERWLTEGKILDEKSVRKSIRDVVMGAMANSDTTRQYKTETVERTLVAAKSAYWLMKSGKYQEAAEVLWDAAYEMIQDVDFIEDETFKQYKGLRDYLRTTSIRLGEEYWSDVDYADFRKRNFGRIKLVKGDTNLDQILDDLIEIAPEWFSESAFEEHGLKQEVVPDILMQIEATLDAIQPYRIAYSSEEAQELAGYIADDLYDIVYEGQEYKSIADTFKERYDAKTKALKQRHEEALAKAKEQFAKKLSREQLKLKEYKAKQKNAKEHAKHFGSIAKNIDWLTDRLINETKDKNIPEGFRKSLAHLLMQFDMQTERSKKLEEKYGPAKKTLEMRKLKDKLGEIAKEDETGEFRYDGYVFYLMEALADKVDGKTIDSLDTEDLIVIDTMLKSIRHNFANYNKIRIDEERVAVANIGDSTIKMMRERIEKYGQRAVYKSAVLSMMDKLLNEGEETPIYFFERLDPEGNGIGAMYKELRRGEDTHIRNIDFLRQRFKQMFGDYFNDKDPGSDTLESWRDDSQSRTFDLTHGTITLNPAQIMSLYCLSKRAQAMGHILGAGIVASPVTFGAKMKDGIKANHEQVESVMITHAEVLEIISTLTPEQVKLADEMQALLNNEMAAWGNETSLEMYGIKLFREKDYFPIKSSSESLAKTADSFEAQEKIKNFGFTKPLVKNASNAIMIDDIFSVVADHCNKMALYNAMAIPISDFMRVYNYTQHGEDGSTTTVQQMIGQAFTRKANAYIMKFLGDVNGNTKTKSDAVDDLMNKALAKYKKASIGMNARVALQQPTAIFRSFMVISPIYFAGVKVSKAEMDEMFEHCPIALWKSWGHYDMDMGRDIEDIMMNNDWSKWDSISMGVYGELDNLTWSIIWQAVKNEVRATHPEVKEGSQEWWDLCNERASEVYDKTQVVDSIFHRSDTMRSKNTLTKMATSFMAEPTLTYNVFRDSLAKARDLIKDGKTGEAAEIIGKMVLVLALNAAAVSASAALWDAVRGKGDDDDDDKRFGHLWLVNFMNNFGDNINMINNIYFVKDIWSLKDGWGTSNMALEGWETLFKGISQAKKKLTEGSDKSWYDILMNLLGGAGYITGIPIKTMMRDLRAIAEKLGIDVFAADSFDEIDQKKTNSIVDSIFEKMGYQKKGSDETGDEEASGSVPSREDLPNNLTDEQKDEIIKNAEKRSKKASEKAEEQSQLSYDDMLYKALKSASGLEGEEYNKKIYSSVANGLKGYIADGDYQSIGMMRTVIEQAGGDVDYFDNRVLEETKSAFKKSLGYDLTHEQRWAMKSQWRYLVNHGMTEEEVSSEIIYKSDLAKDMKVAYRIGDNGTIYQALVPLVDAGLMQSDLERLYQNRNKMDLSKYNGRYKDKLKSTGRFIWPTDGVITSGFGRRSAPTRGASSYHNAIDIGAPQGTPVVAADGGEVIEAGSNGGYGNSVGIRHDDGTISYYNHLYAWNVKVGDTVAQGQQIGQVGSTGISTGPHLDFRLYKNGEYLNPEEYLNKRGS